MKIKVIDRNGKQHSVDATQGDPVMRALSMSDLVEATCGGSCSCATCHVYVEMVWFEKLPAPTEAEYALLDGLLSTRPNSRLACQIELTQDMDGIALEVAPE